MDDNGRIKNENPFAFPLKKDVGVNQGMTLRDYFAAKAMHAMYVNSDILKAADKRDPHGDIAIDSYVIADAMLKARNNSSAE